MRVDKSRQKFLEMIGMNQKWRWSITSVGGYSGKRFLDRRPTVKTKVFDTYAREEYGFRDYSSYKKLPVHCGKYGYGTDSVRVLFMTQIGRNSFLHAFYKKHRNVAKRNYFRLKDYGGGGLDRIYLLRYILFIWHEEYTHCKIT